MLILRLYRPRLESIYFYSYSFLFVSVSSTKSKKESNETRNPIFTFTAVLLLLPSLFSLRPYLTQCINGMEWGGWWKSFKGDCEDRLSDYGLGATWTFSSFFAFYDSRSRHSQLFSLGSSINSSSLFRIKSYYSEFSLLSAAIIGWSRYGEIHIRRKSQLLCPNLCFVPFLAPFHAVFDTYNALL